MAWVYRAGGPVAASSVHCAPSQPHVSANTLPPSSAPPNMTTCSRTASYASPINARGPGPVSATWVHSAPSHSHVSESASVADTPPSRTLSLIHISEPTRLLSISY